MTKEDYPTWDEIEYIHNLRLELNIVELVLCIAEYGYRPFFANYPVYLAIVYEGHPWIQEMYWNDCFTYYTDDFYSQLWRGLEGKPFGYLEERKKRNYKKYQWFDEVLMATPPKDEGIRMTDMFK